MPKNNQTSKNHLSDLSNLATESITSITQLAFLFDEVQERISQLKSYLKAGSPLHLEHFDELDKLLNISIELAHLYETRLCDLEKSYGGE